MTKSEIIGTTMGTIAVILIAVLVPLNIHILNRMDQLSESQTTTKNQVKVLVNTFPEKTIPRLLSLNNMTPVRPNSYAYSSNKKLSDKEVKALAEIGITMKPASPDQALSRRDHNYYYYDVIELKGLENETSKASIKSDKGDSPRGHK